MEGKQWWEHMAYVMGIYSLQKESRKDWKGRNGRGNTNLELMWKPATNPNLSLLATFHPYDEDTWYILYILCWPVQ